MSLTISLDDRMALNEIVAAVASVRLERTTQREIRLVISTSEERLVVHIGADRVQPCAVSAHVYSRQAIRPAAPRGVSVVPPDASSAAPVSTSLPAAPSGCLKRGYATVAAARKAHQTASFRLRFYRCDACGLIHAANHEKRHTSHHRPHVPPRTPRRTQG